MYLRVCEWVSEVFLCVCVYMCFVVCVLMCMSGLWKFCMCVFVCTYFINVCVCMYVFDK